MAGIRRKDSWEETVRVDEGPGIARGGEGVPQLTFRGPKVKPEGEIRQKVREAGAVLRCGPDKPQRSR